MWQFVNGEKENTQQSELIPATQRSSSLYMQQKKRYSFSLPWCPSATAVHCLMQLLKPIHYELEENYIIDHKVTRQLTYMHCVWVGFTLHSESHLHISSIRYMTAFLRMWDDCDDAHNKEIKLQSFEWFISCLDTHKSLPSMYSRKNCNNNTVKLLTVRKIWMSLW